MSQINQFGQKIGDMLPAEWIAPADLPKLEADGEFVSIVGLSVANHLDDLWDAVQHDKTGQSWTYMPVAPFQSKKAFRAWMTQAEQSADPLFHVFIDARTGKAVGLGSYLRIKPEIGVAEVGWLWFSPLMQRTPIATEAMYLMMKHVFDLGYRRYEWKCDSENAPSKRAAQRFGFTFEGVFRQAMHYKGRNRDTAWFSILDGEWPEIQRMFAGWLAPPNFDETGVQRKALGEFRQNRT